MKNLCSLFFFHVRLVNHKNINLDCHQSMVSLMYSLKHKILLTGYFLRVSFVNDLILVYGHLIFKHVDSPHPLVSFPCIILLNQDGLKNIYFNDSTLQLIPSKLFVVYYIMVIVWRFSQARNGIFQTRQKFQILLLKMFSGAS